MFFERQQGNNCRIHAMNNCFGSQVLTVQEFTRFHQSYTSVVANDEKNSLEDDYVSANTWDRTSLLSHILQHKFGMASFTVGSYEMPRFRTTGVIQSLKDCMDPDFPNFFVCNAQHVWCVRYWKTGWFCLDSMSSPRSTTLAEWENDPRLTLVFPWTMARCKRGVLEMQALVSTFFRGQSKEDIICHITRDLSNREPHNFGDVQTWIALFFKYLGMTSRGHRFHIEKYREYESGSKVDIAHAISSLPDLIIFIMEFK